MNVISVISPKGGCGKSTSIFVAATTLQKQGYRVAVIDVCRTAIMHDWTVERTNNVGSSPFKSIEGVTEETFFETVDQLRKLDIYDVLFVDTEGAADVLMLTVLSQTDLALIPMNTSKVDAKLAKKASALVRRVSRQYGRNIPYVFTLSRTSAVASTDKRQILAGLSESGQPYLKSELLARSAFTDIYGEGKTLYELLAAATTKAKKLKYEKAITNAEAFSTELINYVRKSKEVKHAA